MEGTDEGEEERLETSESVRLCTCVCVCVCVWQEPSRNQREKERVCVRESEQFDRVPCEQRTVSLREVSSSAEKRSVRWRTAKKGEREICQNMYDHAVGMWSGMGWFGDGGNVRQTNPHHRLFNQREQQQLYAGSSSSSRCCALIKSKGSKGSEGG